ncbi:MAG: hypothetical protein FWG68_12850 [Defluviitaleaceae bacterium]|nr:hypothetical protein [Defluviitaleaceae bacterium]
MIEIIEESGMNFIAENAFYIEKSPIYAALNKRTKQNEKGISSVEFIRRKGGKLLFIEAKTTFPNPDNPPKENPQRFAEAVAEICEKFIHSLNLYYAILAGVHSESQINNINASDNLTIAFVLVIKVSQPDWCRIIETKINETLPIYIKKIWDPEVFVMNHEKAIGRNLATQKKEKP